MRGILNIPNTLTTVRIVLIPLFVTSVIYNRYDYALFLFIIAALTDMFDGLIARMKSQKTPFGNLLDPLADKFLLVTSFILFSIYDKIPKWLTITIISRDIIVVTGWVILYLITHTAKVEPTLLGKTAITCQLVLICYVLFDTNLPALPDIHPYLIWITAIFTILSGLHYIYRGLKQTNV
ncbi:MAG: CDP-alcohol phosphatidyltransferase family protein [Nitrospirae bacterium]|nr:CDP-alcohol phosphatidyltransferase family protein [Nitrospirota bacterium]MCL5422327.1 CDP-alcohol phosphatidyltransferase family protein [Nitrospirota bacterium]